MKRFLFTTLLFLFCISTFAQNVTKEEAQNIAINYFKKGQLNYRFGQNDSQDFDSVVNDSISLRKISITGKAYLYGIQFSQKGWILVSSHKAVRPILGTCLNGALPDIEDMPDGLKWLLSFYEEVISNITNDTVIQPEWESIRNNSSRTTTDIARITAFDNIKWGQSGNNSTNLTCRRKYNKHCPTSPFSFNCGHCPTGCGAVAIGQVMKYYKWPEFANVPDTAFSGYPITTRETFYDWGVIPNALYWNTSVAKEDAIAYFLRDCGYALKTTYGDNASSTTSNQYIPTLINYFGYSNSMQMISRTTSNNSTFIANIKNELDNHRPVLYTGYSSDDYNVVGHIFVVYGYTNDDHYYINWGWKGECDGAYALDSLTPNYNDLTHRQKAIINIYPNYCTQQKVNPDEEWSQSFTKQYPGNIIIGNRTIASNQQGTVTAGNSIRLTNGFVIAQGADVTMSIDGTPCEDLPDLANNSIPNYHQEESTANVPTRNSIIKIKDRDVIPLSIRQTDDFLSLECGSELSHIILYDIFGKLVIQAHEPTINVSQLPEGIYILQAVTADGQVMQDKFIRTK